MRNSQITLETNIENIDIENIVLIGEEFLVCFTFFVGWVFFQHFWKQIIDE